MTQEVNAGSSTTITLRITRPETALRVIRNPERYDRVALFLRSPYSAQTPGPFRRWDGNAWVADHRVIQPEFNRIVVEPRNHRVSSALEEVVFTMWIPPRFAMGLNLEYRSPASPGRNIYSDAIMAMYDDGRRPPPRPRNYLADTGDGIEDKECNQIQLFCYAAYVSATESFPLFLDQRTVEGPLRGRIWAVGDLVINRRPSVALLSVRDTDILLTEPYFSNAYDHFRPTMRVMTGHSDGDGATSGGHPRRLAAWLATNAPSSKVPWGMVHMVGHSDGVEWLLPGGRNLDAGMIGSSTATCPPSAIDEFSHVVFHLCNFAAPPDPADPAGLRRTRSLRLLEACRTMFSGAPPVHGPQTFVAFRDRPAEEVLQVERGTSGNYQTVETNPNPLTSTNFAHVPPAAQWATEAPVP